MAEVVVVDDDRIVREMVQKSLEKVGFRVRTASSAEAGLQAIHEQIPDVVLLDVRLPGASGLEVFAEITEVDRNLPVVVMTSSSDSDTAIKAMQLGAFDYLTKPLSLPALAELTLAATRSREVATTPVALAVGDRESGKFVGQSHLMLEVFKSIGRVARQNIAVLIRGESGTGKELVAKAICQHSARADGPFIAINCAALPDALLESELFGHEVGAFTDAKTRRIGKFEQCDGGTIFLDEVGDMSPLTQAKILRLLQEQQFERVGGNTTIQTNVRIIAATNCDLEAMVSDGTFREDLFYRLNGMTISLPPLRQRENDIDLLIEHQLMQTCRELSRDDVEGMNEKAVQALRDYHWPGNVRELQSVVRQAVVATTGPVLGLSSLPKSVLNADSTDVGPSQSGDSVVAFVRESLSSGSTDLYAETMKFMESFLFREVMAQTNGNQTKAAGILGVTRAKVRDRLNQIEAEAD
jgi:two-component system nitrogen regulation response regulator GlnG